MEEANFAIGILMSLTAGVFLGTFAAPMKKIINWRWENTWLLYSLWACIILPWLLAFFTVPDLFKVYSNVEATTIERYVRGIVVVPAIWAADTIRRI